MTQHAITNYTTYDLAYYYADLRRIPRLSQEEYQQLMQQHLLASPTEQVSHLDTQARNRLIEGHLKLATHIAIDRCPPSHYHALPDILGEVALELVKATQRYDRRSEGEGHFPSYVVACTDYALKRTVANDRLIRVPSSAIARATHKGTVSQLYELQPESLDAWMQWFNTDEVEEPPTSSILPTEAAPPRDPALRAQVHTWLSSLSPRAQQVLTLRYGLSEEDERALSGAEVARVLDLPRNTVSYLERDALKRIKALVEGSATLVEKDGQRRVKGMAPLYLHAPTLTPEHDVLFQQAATRLCEQGLSVSGRRLAKESGKNVHLALAFLRLHRDEFPLATRAGRTAQAQQHRMEHLARVCADLEAPTNCATRWNP